MVRAQGITTDEAQTLFLRFGFNEINVKTKRTAISIFLRQFANFLAILLTIAAILSFVLGDRVDGFFILAIILLNSVLGFVQEYRAERALAALKKLAVVKTVVIRDGGEKEIDSKFLVPGDVIKVEEGDKIPADAKLLEAINLEVNEASLTGESLPVFKKADEEEHNNIFLGTIVVRGRALAIVEATGMRTRFGTIAKGLSEIEEEPTSLQLQLSRLAKQLALVALGASILVLLVGLFRGEAFLRIFLTSVSLAVAAVPEGLPVVLTITLAVGVHRMAKKFALVRKLSAIETLGTASIIATDKTGTITKNEMRVREIGIDQEIFRVDVHGVKPMNATIKQFFKASVLANTASLVFKHDKGSLDILGDPTEGALLLAAHDFGLSPMEMRDKGQLIDEFSFDSQRKTMSIIWKDPPVQHQSNSGSVGGEVQDEMFVYVKGAPETILDRSITILQGGKAKILADEQRRRIEAMFEDAAKRSLRVIAVAGKRWIHREKSKANRDEVESELTFIGFAALYDPPRPEVKEAAKEADMAGIRTIIITGDNEFTANAIATEVGLINLGEDILTGAQVDNLTDEEMLKILPNVRIFARTTPEHKHRIVKLYQRLGHVVAVTGDGVNDALALRQANVGVAMGIAGTDVAKEAADVIVTDDNYATIVRAIEEGRVIFDNIVKSVVYLASGNLGEILTILTAVILGLPPILFPVQILWINLVTDGLPALALAVDPKDPLIMSRKPRVLSQSIIGNSNAKFILAVGSGIASIVLLSFALGLVFLDETKARTIAFTLLIVLHVSVAFLVRKNHSLFSNRFLIVSVLIVLFLQALIIFVPTLQPIFRIGQLW